MIYRSKISILFPHNHFIDNRKLLDNVTLKPQADIMFIPRAYYQYNKESLNAIQFQNITTSRAKKANYLWRTSNLFKQSPPVHCIQHFCLNDIRLPLLKTQGICNHIKIPTYNNQQGFAHNFLFECYLLRHIRPCLKPFSINVNQFPTTTSLHKSFPGKPTFEIFSKYLLDTFVESIQKHFYPFSINNFAFQHLKVLLTTLKSLPRQRKTFWSYNTYLKKRDIKNVLQIKSKCIVIKKAGTFTPLHQLSQLK